MRNRTFNEIVGARDRARKRLDAALTRALLKTATDTVTIPAKVVKEWVIAQNDLDERLREMLG